MLFASCQSRRPSQSRTHPFVDHLFSDKMVAFVPRSESSWLVNLKSKDLFALSLEVLSRQSFLEVFDPEHQTLRTDWRKFILNDQLFREKLSIVIQGVSHRQSILAIHSQIEKHVGPNPKGIYHWLPIQTQAQFREKFLHDLKYAQMKQNDRLSKMHAKRTPPPRSYFLKKRKRIKRLNP
jgi:hypothetical protein